MIMAFNILIEKVAESEIEVIYSFHDTAYPAECGELRLDKRLGTIEMTKPTREAFFQRASVKVSNSYREGDFPDRLSWAS
jgi:hypothetical protein